MGIAGVPLYTNEAIASLEIKPGASVTPEFLRYALTACSSEAGANHAVLGKVLNKAKVESLPIPLPPLGEQQRIVDILSRAEGIVRLRREAQQKAAEIIPALFLDMFGDPATNPKGWPLRPFSELGSLDRGRSRHRPRDAEELYGGPYPFIQTGDVSNSGGLITRYSSTYSEAGLAQSKLWKKGTLCITIAANIAQTGVLGFDACFPDSVVGFLGGDEVSTEYIQVWLSFLQPALEAYAPQVAQKNINLDILRKLPVMSPPLALQQNFSHRCRDVLSLRLQQNRSLTVAQATFDALLAQSFAPPTAQQAAA
jgi:type I restriction enzyme S subunit